MNNGLVLEELLADARAETGLWDIGEDESSNFRDGLWHFLEDVNAEICCAPSGLEPMRAYVHNALVNRLRAHDDINRHSEIRDELVDDPIYLIGLPRTGTTKLFRMLSVDPAVQSLEFWRALNPAPFPEAQPQQPDPRIALARANEELLAAQSPEFWSMHSLSAHGAEEDLILQEYSFQTPFLAVRAGAHQRYLPWLQATDPEHRASYRFSSLMLRYLQWQDGGARGRPWVLKNVAVFGNLPTLLDTHPRAVLVQCHRDPRVAMASMLRLFELTRMTFTTRTDFDLVEHGRAFLSFFAGQANRNVIQRQALSPEVPVIDVHYEDIRRDPFTTMERIRRLRGGSFTTQARAAANQWAAENPQYRYGRVPYSLERYGLTSDEVADAFAPYIAYFDIEKEDCA